MAQDLIVSFLSSVPKGVLANFTTPPLTLAVPSPKPGSDGKIHGREWYANWLQQRKDGKGRVIPAMFAEAGGKGAIGRVAVIGFSNGVDSGVSQVLDAADATKIDFVGAFDGIHGSFLGGKMFPSSYGKWIAYAMLAAATKSPDAPTLVVTHSSIEPPFPSTTETANLIWQDVLKRIPQDYMATYYGELDDLLYPGGLSIKSVDTAKSGKPMPSWTWQSFTDGWYVRRNANSFSCFGWGDPGVSAQGRINAKCRDRFNNTADHIFQAEAVLPAILNAYLVARWNPLCGDMPVNGFGAAACAPGQGRPYDAGPDGPLVSPYPLGVSLPETPATCAYPPAGKVIIGGKDPCATESAPIPLPPELPGLPGAAAEGLSVGAKLLAGAAGLTAGYLGVRYLSSKTQRTP